MEVENLNEENAKCSTGGVVTFSLGLVAGTFSALICKMAYCSTSVGLNGDEKLFAKPIMMLFLMFLGMIPAIFFWLIQQTFFVKDETKRDIVTMKTLMILVIPSLCDLFCTLLLLVAQLYITASMWQLMRGSIIIITALLKRFVLQHRLKRYMWAGVSVITIAMVLVASTSLFGSSPDASNTKDPRVGILLVLVGCLAQGVQYVFEEKVMAVDNAPPLVVIGFEGLWGTLLTLILVYPLAYHIPGEDNGSFEDPYDAIAMLYNSRQLTYLVIAFIVTVTCYNCMAVYVTKYLSAIWHAILDNFRPVTIWGLDLIIYYFLLPGKGYGEEWVQASWLQLGGLLVLFLGTGIYNGSFGSCGEPINVYTPIADQPHDLEEIELMKSPYISKSPLIHNQLAVRSPSFHRGTDDARKKAALYRDV